MVHTGPKLNEFQRLWAYNTCRLAIWMKKSEYMHNAKHSFPRAFQECKSESYGSISVAFFLCQRNERIKKQKWSSITLCYYVSGALISVQHSNFSCCVWMPLYDGWVRALLNIILFFSRINWVNWKRSFMAMEHARQLQYVFHWVELVQIVNAEWITKIHRTCNPICFVSSSYS